MTFPPVSLCPSLPDSAPDMELALQWRCSASGWRCMAGEGAAAGGSAWVGAAPAEGLVVICRCCCDGLCACDCAGVGGGEGGGWTGSVGWL